MNKLYGSQDDKQIKQLEALKEFGKNPLVEKSEQHSADKYYEDRIDEIQKRGKSWLVKHLNKQDQETEVQRLAEDIKRENGRKAKVKEIKEVLSDIEINKILSNENIKKLLTPEEIDKISAKEFKKILSKEEIKQILPDEFKKILDDYEIKNRLESYVRKAISQILFLHLKYETQEKVLRKIDLFTLNRRENPFS